MSKHDTGCRCHHCVTEAGMKMKPQEPFQCFVCNEIGMTMGDTTVEQLPDGTWKATCPIGTLFGSEVEGECNGAGATKEAALESLKQSRRKLHDSLWG